MELDFINALVQGVEKNTKAEFIGPPKTNPEFIAKVVKELWKEQEVLWDLPIILHMEG